MEGMMWRKTSGELRKLAGFFAEKGGPSASNQVEAEQMGKFVRVLLVVNLCLWVYFWIAFAHASHPFHPDPLGHPAGSGYVRMANCTV
jgi:hypothetical protein